MTYQPLARAWRPQAFDQVVGQASIVQTLTHALQGGRLAQAYLFSGQHGVGKTSLARIMAKALNCASGPTPTPCGHCASCKEITDGSSLDVLEIDAASNSKVEEMRQLLETVQYRALGGRYKVYIIDEIHRLSAQAFDALLKTLEEPPPQTCFILATTELQKVPDTIFSRCQHFGFGRPTLRELRSRLEEVAKAEGVQFTERGLITLAKAADGSLRDALNLLDKAIAACGPVIPDDQLLDLLGAVSPDRLRALIAAILRRDAPEVLRVTRDALERGDEPSALLAGLMEEVRHMTVVKLTEAPDEELGVPKDDFDRLAALARDVSIEDLHRLFTLLTQAQDQLKTVLHPGLATEMALLKAAHLATLQPIERLVDRLIALEARLTAHSEPPPALPHRPPASLTATSPKKDVAALWPEVVNRIKAQKPQLGACLEAGQPTAAAPDEIIIAFTRDAAWQIGLVERDDNLALVRDILAQLFGRPVRVRLVSTGSPLQAPPQPPIVQEALRIFEGRVVEPSRGSE